MGAGSFLGFSLPEKNEETADGPRDSHPQSPAALENDDCCCSQLEPENNASVVTEVALVLIALGKVIAEASQHKIKLRRPDREVVANGNIEAPANDEIESIIGRGMRGGASTRAHANVMEEIVVSIGVGPSK